ncbi:MAG: hypothetical protein ACYTGL_12315 [Planctomycetota bacterium]|jgi:hypothetical protein
MTRKTKVRLCVTLAVVGGCSTWLVSQVQQARIAAWRSRDK